MTGWATGGTLEERNEKGGGAMGQRVSAADGRGMKVVAGLLLFTATVTVLYWVLYFATGAVQVESSAVYKAFEDSFPAADAWMAAACATGAAGIIRRREWGLLFALLGGSALIFLGLMDVTYNILQGMYRNMNPEMVGETLINVYTLAFGPFLIGHVWANRRYFLAAGAEREIPKKGR